MLHFMGYAITILCTSLALQKGYSCKSESTNMNRNVHVQSKQEFGDSSTKEDSDIHLQPQRKTKNAGH